MAGIYGSMLQYFPELFHRYELYPVLKSANGGFSVSEGTERKSIVGIVMDGRAVTALGGGKSNSAAWLFKGNELDMYGKKQLWSETNLDDYLPIDTDDYESPCCYAIVDTRVKEKVPLYYMITEKLSWTIEGDFYRYEVRLMGGNHAINEQDDSADSYAGFLS